MKGLIMKDFYVLAKTIKSYIFIIFIYAIFFGVMDGKIATAIFVSTIVIAMAPVNAIAYDEQSKWDKMVGTMPVSARDIVMAKYIFSLILSVAAAFCSALLAFIFDKFGSSTPFIDLLAIMAMAIIVAVFYHSLLFPIIYKFGTTKGRLYSMLIMVFPAVIVFLLSIFGLGSSSIITLLTENSKLLVAVSILSIILMYIGSIALSVRIYKKKEF